MTIQRDLGHKGEMIAVKYLQRLGYQILETNWRFRRAEIDIIAMHDLVLVCVEVKSRSYDYFGPPDAAVGRKKEALLTDALQAYMEIIEHEWEIRFDIISIMWQREGTPEIKHYVGAFFPGLQS